MIDGASPTDKFKSRFEPTHLAASQVRGRLRRYLDGRRIQGDLADDIELTASELLSNAVEQQPAEPVEIELTIADAVIYLTVTNHRPHGTPAELPTGTSRDEMPAERGRGLAIVHSLADGMWVHGDRISTSTSVSCLHKRRT